MIGISLGIIQELCQFLPNRCKGSDQGPSCILGMIISKDNDDVYDSLYRIGSFASSGRTLFCRNYHIFWRIRQHLKHQLKNEYISLFTYPAVYTERILFYICLLYYHS